MSWTWTLTCFQPRRAAAAVVPLPATMYPVLRCTMIGLTWPKRSRLRMILGRSWIRAFCGCGVSLSISTTMMLGSGNVLSSSRLRSLTYGPGCLMRGGLSSGCRSVPSPAYAGRYSPYACKPCAAPWPSSRRRVIDASPRSCSRRTSRSLASVLMRPGAVVRHLPQHLGHQVDVVQIAVVEQADEDVSELAADSLRLWQRIREHVVQQWAANSGISRAVDSPGIDSLGHLGVQQRHVAEEPIRVIVPALVVVVGFDLLSRRLESLAQHGLVCEIHSASPVSGSCTTSDRKSTRLNSSHRCISYAVPAVTRSMYVTDWPFWPMRCSRSSHCLFATADQGRCRKIATSAAVSVMPSPPAEVVTSMYLSSPAWNLAIEAARSCRLTAPVTNPYESSGSRAAASSISWRDSAKMTACRSGPSSCSTTSSSSSFELGSLSLT